VQLTNRIARQFSHGAFRHVIVFARPFKSLNSLRSFDFSDDHYGRDETRRLALKTNSVVETNDRDDFGAWDRDDIGRRRERRSRGSRKLRPDLRLARIYEPDSKC
jgi:hypothetical protein